jgi:hypothetical protein
VHLDGVLRLEGGQRVAGVHGPHEGVAGHHFQDVRKRLDVDGGRHAGQDVLAVGGAGSHDVIVFLLLLQVHDEPLDVLGEVVAERCAVRVQHRSYAGDLSGLLGDGTTVLPGHEDVHIGVHL